MESDSIDNGHAVPVREELDDVIHIYEVRKAVKQMKCNKASGGDGIPAGVYNHGETTLVELKHASVVTIFKRGSCTECGYFLGSSRSQLSVAGKILAKVILNRRQLLSESIIPETQ